MIKYLYFIIKCALVPCAGAVEGENLEIIPFDGSLYIYIYVCMYIYICIDRYRYRYRYVYMHIYIYIPLSSCLQGRLRARISSLSPSTAAARWSSGSGDSLPGRRDTGPLWPSQWTSRWGMYWYSMCLPIHTYICICMFICIHIYICIYLRVRRATGPLSPSPWTSRNVLI